MRRQARPFAEVREELRRRELRRTILDYAIFLLAGLGIIGVLALVATK